MSSKPKPSLERVRYYPRQLMTVEDMRAEQEYFLERMRRHNRLLHGWGIVCGLEVQSAATADKPWQARICPGFALSPQGDEIYVGAPVLFDLARAASDDEDDCAPCPRPSRGAGRTTDYLAIRYTCREARPVRIDPACGCSNTGCETSRQRDDYTLALLDTLPVPYDETSLSAEESFLRDLKAGIDARSNMLGISVPSCSASTEPGPWIILAVVYGDKAALPAGAAEAGADVINNLWEELDSGSLRRPLPKVQNLFGAMVVKSS